MNTELTKVETALTEFDKIEAGLAELRDKYAGVVFTVTTPAGMKDALAARAIVRKPRYAAEEIRKAAKAPILELGRSLDAKAKYITAELLKIEDPIQAQITAEESRKEQAIIAENQRKAAITQAIYDLNMIVPGMAGKSSGDIAARILALQEYDLTEWADEFIVEAEKARAGALASLQQLHAGALAQEQTAAAEAKRIADEKADFERQRIALASQRAELEAQQKAERERLEAARLQQEGIERAARAKIEEAERASRASIEAQEREARMARAKADKEALDARLAEEDRLRGIRQAEELRLQAEADRIARERRAVEEAQHKEREAAEAKATAERQAKEAEQRRIQQQQNDILDGRAMLTAFNTRFGHLAEFKVIADLIDDFLSEEPVRKSA